MSFKDKMTTINPHYCVGWNNTIIVQVFIKLS